MILPLFFLISHSSYEKPVPMANICDELKTVIHQEKSDLPIFKRAFEKGALNNLEKREFETTEEWNNRFKEALKPLLGYGKFGQKSLSFFTISVPESSLYYNSDTETMNLKYRLSLFGNRDGFSYDKKPYLLDSNNIRIGGYRASNSFGVNTYVEKIEVIEYNLRFSDAHFKNAPDKFYVPRSAALEFKKSMKIGILSLFNDAGVEIKKSHYPPTLDIPKDRVVTDISLNVQPICIFLYGGNNVVNDWHLDLPNRIGISLPK